MCCVSFPVDSYAKSAINFDIELIRSDLFIVHNRSVILLMLACVYISGSRLHYSFLPPSWWWMWVVDIATALNILMPCINYSYILSLVPEFCSMVLLGLGVYIALSSEILIIRISINCFRSFCSLYILKCNLFRS